MQNRKWTWTVFALAIAALAATDVARAATPEPVISGKSDKLTDKARVGVGNQNCTYSGQKDTFFTAAHCLRKPESSVMLHLVGGEIVKLKCLRNPKYTGGPADDIGVCAIDKTHSGDDTVLAAADEFAAPPPAKEKEQNCLSSEMPKANDPLVLTGCAAGVDQNHKPKGPPRPDYCAEGKSIVGRVQSNVIMTPWKWDGNNLAKGDSGGPAKDKDGNIVGINSMIAVGEKNIFASVAYNKTFIDDAAKKLGVNVCWKDAKQSPPPIADRKPDEKPKPEGDKPNTPGEPAPDRKLGLKLELNLKLRLAVNGGGATGATLGTPHVAVLPEKIQIVSRDSH